MPRLSRFRKSGGPDPLKPVTSLDAGKRIIAALKVTETYMFICNVAIGMTMVLSITQEIGLQELRYQRMPARSKPAEDNMMVCLH